MSPQRVYLPLGELRAVAAYPNEEGMLDDSEMLTKPRAVFLDESTSALDEGLELTL